MNLEAFFQPLLSFAGTFDLTLVLFLYLLCFVGEVATGVPYLLETVWLLAGYHVGSGILAPVELLFLWLAALAGRQTGAVVLYYLSRAGSVPLARAYRRFFKTSLAEKVDSSSALPYRLLRKVSSLTVFSTALGRLAGLRIPLTLALAIKRQPAVLVLAVLLSSLVWDGAYIVLGMLGARVVLKPVQMLLYSFLGLTVLYLAVFAVRRVFRGRGPRREKLPA